MARPRSAVETDLRARSSRMSQEQRLFSAMFVNRLRRIQEQRITYCAELTPEARYLVDRSLYSTYWDCVRLGLRDEARQVLGLTSD